MRNITNAFRRELYNDNRAYVCTVTIQLTDNTELTIDESQIWQNGLVTNDNVSNESSFSALGSVIVNSGTLTLNNIYDDFSSYTFDKAKVIISVGLEIDGVLESIKLGTFTVDDTNYNGALITLYCLDNMHKFDKPYSGSSLVYPATLQAIVTDACTNCGVLLQTTTFPNYNITIADRPIDEAITYREVISYAAVLAGCFARCNADGKLELKWFNRNSLDILYSNIDGGVFDSATPYASGDSVNGGDFNPWNLGDIADGGSFAEISNVHYITAISSQDISVDDVIITGVRITTSATDIESTDTSHLYGNEGYVISIEKIPFITESNVATIGAYLQTLLVGLKFRKATLSHLNDPSIEAGDTALVFDRKGNIYPILVTNTTFNVSQYQRTISAAETPVKNSAVQYTEIIKTEVESKKLVQQEKTLREQMGDDLTDAINAKAGMYETRVQEQGGGYTYYMHDKPLLADSTAVIKVTNEAVAVTPDYQAQTPTWYGLTVDGNFIANIMSVIGIDFDWGTGGTLVLGGQNNVNGSLTIKDASNNVIGTWDNTGINTIAGTIGGFTITDTELTKSVTVNNVEYVARISAYTYGGALTTPAFAVTSKQNNVVTTLFGVDYSGQLYVKQGTIGSFRFYEISGLANEGHFGALPIASYYNGGDCAYIINHGDSDRRFWASVDQNGAYGQDPDFLSVQLKGNSLKFGRSQNYQTFTDIYFEIYSDIVDIAEAGEIPDYQGRVKAIFGNVLKLSLLEHSGNNSDYGLNIEVGEGTEPDFPRVYLNSFLAISVDSELQLDDSYENTLILNALGNFTRTKVNGDLYVGTANVTDAIKTITRSGTTFTATRLDGTTFTFTQQDNNSVTGVKGNAETSYRTGDINLTPANIGALALTGGTLTGNVVVGQTTDTVSRGVTSRNSLGNVGLTVGTDGSHGLYSGTKGGFLLYATKDANSTNSTLYVPRPLTVSGLASVGNNVIATANDTSERYFRAVNSNGSIELNVSIANKGVYDRSGGRWIMYLATNSAADTAVIIPRGLQVGEAGINGYIELYHATPYIDFHFGRSAADYTTRLWESSSGTLTCTGYFVAKDYSGSARQVVTSYYADGNRIAGIGSDATKLYVTGQHGVTGSTYSSKNVVFSTSDVRLKEHIEDTDVEALPVINRMRVRKFDWKDGRADKHQAIGVVADELETIDKRLAVGGGYDEDGSMNVKSIDNFYLTGYLLKAVQELCDRIEMLENENKKLMTLVNKLLERI